LKNFDVIIIGAGMAGASVASELSPAVRVVLIEAEPQPGYHSTGRSAALFSEIYGKPLIRALSRASRRFFLEPHLDVETPLVVRRGTLLVASEGQRTALDEYFADPAVRKATQRLNSEESRALVPILRAEAAVESVFEPDSYDIDVHALHQAYLRDARRKGARLVTGARITAIARAAGGWRVTTADDQYTASAIVNAAGAWADHIASMAGMRGIGLTPMRRTMAVADAPKGHDSHAWPMVVAADESFYFKPDAGRLLLSPADETPTEPCDCQPEEFDVAVAAHRYEEATGLTVSRILGRWAGLRTFAPDRLPVVGSLPDEPGFFWMAGQGGFGIQIAPALAAITAAVVQGHAPPDHVTAEGVLVDDMAPSRFVAREIA
jgi:D-arginine dehydrogenase